MNSLSKASISRLVEEVPMRSVGRGWLWVMESSSVVTRRGPVATSLASKKSKKSGCMVEKWQRFLSESIEESPRNSR